MLAEQENILALVGLTGTSDEEVAERLKTRVAIRSADNIAARRFADDVSKLLSRSLCTVEDAACDVELAVGTRFATNAPLRLRVALDAQSLTISENDMGAVDDATPGLLRRIAACYAAGNVIARTVGGAQFESIPKPFVAKFANLGISSADLSQPITLNDAVLVGAGGVGNGFMWALAELDVVGHLTIADPKRISQGGLNRCLYFTEADVGEEKAQVLAARTLRLGFSVDAFPHAFSELVARRQRVRRVFTTPDSREARRSIQADLPIEVLDASTTDLTAVVVHSHRQPTEGACLSCIYPHIMIEDQRRIHIAEGLGLSLEEVRKGTIDERIANKLAALHPALEATDLVGRAFDTVYKEQCGKAALLNAAGQQAVAPLAFISNFAGALLAIELVRYERNLSSHESCYLNLDPWRPPHAHARRARNRLPGCEFCSANGPTALRAVWPEIYT